MADNTGTRFEKLVGIMARLRGPGGCPWDREQDFDTLKPMLIEEAYELLEAIDHRNYSGLNEELGDLLLHVLFHAQMGKEIGAFDINTVIESISEKLVRRHPHVFGDKTATTSDQVVENWEAIKAQEKAEGLQGRSPEERSLLEGIPSKLPALHEAHKISSRAAGAGFDWPDIDGIFEKLQEEVRELKEILNEQGAEASRDRLEDEIGDLLFVIVNIARYLKIDSESSLKHANRKFRERFQYMERELQRQGKSVSDSSLAELEALWQHAKARAGEE